MEVKNKNPTSQKNFLTPEKFDELINQKSLTKIQGLFEDPLFPADENSLNSFFHRLQIKENNIINPNKQLEWVRLSNTYKPNQLNICKYDEKSNISLNPDIVNENIGNNNFLTVLSTLSNYPQKLKEIIFKNTSLTKNGFFEVNLFINGAPVILLIDDFFPMYQDESEKKSIKFLGFQINPETMNIWPLILMKIWVKFNNIFSDAINLNLFETYEFFSPYPISLIEHLNENKDSLEKNIENSFLSGTFVTANIIDQEPKRTKHLNRLGLKTDHSYTVLDYQSLKIPSLNKEIKNVILLNLFSEFSDLEWAGDWSKNSPLWTFSLRKQLDKLTKKQNYLNEDNSFWITLDDYIRYFNKTLFISIFNNFKEKYLSINYDHTQKFNFLDVKILKKSSPYFIFNQMNTNIFPNAHSENYINIFLFEKISEDEDEEKSYRIRDNVFTNLGRANIFEVDESGILEPGEYCLAYTFPIKEEIPVSGYVQLLSENIPEIYHPNENKFLNITIYCENINSIEIESMDKESTVIIDSILLDSIDFEANSVSHINKTIFRYSELNEEHSKKISLFNDQNLGFSYIFYDNYSQGCLHEKFNISAIENYNIFFLMSDSLESMQNRLQSEEIKEGHVLDPSFDTFDQKLENYLMNLTGKSKIHFHIKDYQKNRPFDFEIMIAPYSQALLYFEKISENNSINFTTKSAFTYTPITLFKASNKDYKFLTSKIIPRKIKYQEKDSGIVQYIVEYGSGLGYLFVNNSRNYEANISFDFKNAVNLVKCVDSNNVYENMHLTYNLEKGFLGGDKEEEYDYTEELENMNLTSQSEVDEDGLGDLNLKCSPKTKAFVQFRSKNVFETCVYDLEVKYDIRIVH